MEFAGSSREPYLNDPYKTVSEELLTEIQVADQRGLRKSIKNNCC